jgi:ABC-2 type transport system ATP-binding protein
VSPRFGLCRTLLHDPQLYVFDEPFNALDAAGSALLDETLAELAGRTLVVATHDPDRVAQLATQRLAMA